ncbi:MAG: hypothetical protein JSS63_15080 [Bacteroidetes bacterium]|nr:hypothetical protein [Bacteroidota bacterium]
MNKLILVLLLFISINARAQYAEFYAIEVPERYVMGTLLFKDILLKDAEVMKSNKVKEVYIKTGEKTEEKMLVNSQGYIEDYYTFNPETDAIETHWRFGYGEGNILTSAYFRHARQRINYILSYENGRLAKINCDSAGTESQWSFEYEAGRMSKMIYTKSAFDSFALTYNFLYDAESRVISVQTGDGEKIYSITYDNSSLKISYGMIFSNKYKFKDERITEKVFEYQTKEYLQTQTPSKIITTQEEYIYNEKGLITESVIKSDSNEKKSVFEYSFYE